MEAEQKMLIETRSRALILQANQVGKAVDQAKSFRVNSREMGKRVYQLLQMQGKLLCVITLNPILLYLIPIDRVISEANSILREALDLACNCKRKTIFCRLFTGTQTNNNFHKLFHRLDASINNMNRFLIIYNPDFNSAFNEIFLSLPEILSNDSSIPSAWSCMVTKIITWELATMLTSTDNTGIVEGLILLCLAKLVGEEHGGLQCNCLMIIMEITAAAESNLDLRCKAFKTKSPGSKAIVDQLLRIIKESEDPKLQVLAIKSTGSLARIFSERANLHVIDVLVSQLGNKHQEVATEAIVALIKFVSEDNYLCKAHSKRMIEFNAIQALVKLLRDGEMTQQLNGLVLLCYLALNVDYSKAVEEARVVTAIQQSLTRERRCHRVVSHHPGLKELVDKALQNLTLYYKY